MYFYIAQIIGVLITILIVGSIQQKKQKHIMLWQLIANILESIQYCLLSAFTGAVTSFLAVIRCLILFVFKNKNRKPSLLFICTYSLIVVVLGALTWENLYSIIPIATTILYTYGFWQENTTITRICCAIVAFSLAIYCFIVMAYTGAIGLTLEFISSIIAMWRYDWRVKKTRANCKECPLTNEKIML